MKHTKGLCSVRKSCFAQGCRFALWALVAFGVVLAYGDAASGFTVDTAIPAGNAIVNSIDGDTVSIRQDLRDTKGEWFYWAFRSPTPAAPW